MRPFLLALGLLLLAASPAAALTTKDLDFAVKTGPNGDVDCTITARLYTPDGASRANPVPAVLGTNGFGGSKDSQDDIARGFASRGYAFLSYSGLGFGGSTCQIYNDDPDFDGRAGAQLLDFLAGDKAATDGTKIDFIVLDRPGDPRVGMTGGSYGGQIQFAIAGVDPRLDAINPQITWNDLLYSLTANNTDFDFGVTSKTAGVNKNDWPALFTGLGIAAGLQGVGDGDTSRLGTCPGFRDENCQSLVRSAAQGYPDKTTEDYLRHSSVSTYMERIKVPTFLSQGQADTLFNLQEAVATYDALRSQGTPVKMLWRSSGHTGGDLGTSEYDPEKMEQAYETRLLLEFMDFYLRGIGDPPALDFTFFRPWVKYEGDAAPAVGQSPGYPAADERPYALSGSGALAAPGTKPEAGEAAFAVSVAPTGTGGGFADAGTSDAPGSFAAFETAPLADAVDVAGVPSVTVELEAPVHAATQAQGPAGMLILFAKIEDVAPNGDAVLPRNLNSPVRIPDVTKPVTIELPGIVHRFAKGHRIRLVLSSASAVYAGNRIAGPVTVVNDPKEPNLLQLPVLGMVRAQGSGPSGTTPYVPAQATPQPQRAGSGGPAATPQAARLPRSCRSRRVLRFTLRRGARDARVTVDGRRVKIRRTGRVVRVSLVGRRRGTYRIVISARVAGEVVRSARTYRTCRPQRGR